MSASAMECSRGARWYVLVYELSQSMVDIAGIDSCRQLVSALWALMSVNAVTWKQVCLSGSLPGAMRGVLFLL